MKVKFKTIVNEMKDLVFCFGPVCFTIFCLLRLPTVLTMKTEMVLSVIISSSLIFLYGKFKFFKTVYWMNTVCSTAIFGCFLYQALSHPFDKQMIIYCAIAAVIVLANGLENLLKVYHHHLKAFSAISQTVKLAFSSIVFFSEAPQDILFILMTMFFVNEASSYYYEHSPEEETSNEK